LPGPNHIASISPSITSRVSDNLRALHIYLPPMETCPEVDRDPGKLGGAWCVKRTRIPVQAVIDNARDGCTAEEIVGEIFEGITAETVRRILRHAKAGGAMTDDPPMPPLWGEDSLSALLLAMLLQHSETATRGELDSYAITANADAMIACAEDGLIEVTEQAGRRIFAKVTPEGWALLERLRVEQEREQPYS
jgi:uncharacterized protein (DUF433 family)